MAVYPAFSPRYLPDRSMKLEAVCWAVHPAPASMEDMRKDPRRAPILVTQQFRNRPKVVAALKPVSGQRATKRMTTGRLGYRGLGNGLAVLPAQGGVVERRPPPLAGAPFLLVP